MRGYLFGHCYAERSELCGLIRVLLSSTTLGTPRAVSICAATV